MSDRKPWIPFLVGVLMSAAFAEGFEPDPEKYEQTLRHVVAFSCNEFAKCGLAIEPSRLKFGEHEIVDSFLKGRETYRECRGRVVPMAPKLKWLADLLGDRYPEYEARWKRMIADRKAHPDRVLTRAEIAKRLDELKALGDAPVMMDDGTCRSSSGHVSCDMKCIHCGRHTFYCRLDDADPGLPPEGCKYVAEELGRWGIRVEVDGREACPHCCPVPRDFKIGMWATKLRFKKDLDWSTVYECRIRAMRGDQELTVCDKGGEGRYCSYKVQGRFEESWLNDRDSCVYEKPNGHILCGKGSSPIKYAEPREEVSVPCKGTFVRIVDFVCEGTVVVSSNLVDVIESVRASHLYYFPPTYYIVNGHRFNVEDGREVQALLAFAQGYSTFFYGAFGDHCSLYRCEPWLRKILLGEECPQQEKQSEDVAR